MKLAEIINQKKPRSGGYEPTDCGAMVAFMFWRTLHSATPQSMMMSWLEVPTNKCAFDQNLVASLTMREEDENHITGSMLRTRIQACALYNQLVAEWSSYAAEQVQSNRLIMCDLMPCIHKRAARSH